MIKEMNNNENPLFQPCFSISLTSDVSRQAKYETSFLDRYYLIKLLQAEFHVDRLVPYFKTL